MKRARDGMSSEQKKPEMENKWDDAEDRADVEAELRWWWSFICSKWFEYFHQWLSKMMETWNTFLHSTHLIYLIRLGIFTLNWELNSRSTVRESLNSIYSKIFQLGAVNHEIRVGNIRDGALLNGHFNWTRTSNPWIRENASSFAIDQLNEYSWK